MSEQLFPIRVRATAPKPFGNSADLAEVAIGEDGMDYAVKTVHIAASEALCYQIYAACGIAVPHKATLLMIDGSYAFGSRIERGLSDYASCAPTEKSEWLKECSPIISSICALDFLIANEDRHMGNFLFFTGLNGRKSCMALDFSRALLYASWPLPDTWKLHNNTTSTEKGLRQLHFWDSAAATQSLLSAAAIKQSTWANWIDALPTGWITAGFETTLSTWWGSNDFQKRLQDCLSAVK